MCEQVFIHMPPKDELVDFMIDFLTEYKEDQINKNGLGKLAISNSLPVLETVTPRDYTGNNRRRRRGVSAIHLDFSFDEIVSPQALCSKTPKSAKEKEEIRGAIQENILFSCLDEEQMNIVLDVMEYKSYHAGESIIKQGDDACAFFIIGTGKCDVHIKEGDDAPQKFIRTLISGQSFGELALMYNSKRTASITARTDCMLWVMNGLVFKKVLMCTTSKKRKQYEGFLCNVPILKLLRPYERSVVADVLVETHYKDKEYIITCGDTEETNFYILAEGAAVATKVIDDTNIFKVVKRYKVGDYFGELALITSAPRAANVIAEGPCKVISLDYGSFTRLLGPCEEVLKRNKKNYEEAEHQILSEK